MVKKPKIRERVLSTSVRETRQKSQEPEPSELELDAEAPSFSTNSEGHVVPVLQTSNVISETPQVDATTRLRETAPTEPRERTLEYVPRSSSGYIPATSGRPYEDPMVAAARRTASANKPTTIIREHTIAPGLDSSQIDLEQQRGRAPLEQERERAYSPEAQREERSKRHRYPWEV